MVCYILKDLRFEEKDNLKKFCKDNDLEFEFNNKKKLWTILDINENKKTKIETYLKVIKVFDFKVTKRKNEKHVKKIITNILFLNDNQPIHKIKSNNEIINIIKELNIKYNTDIDYNLYI